MAPEDHGVSDCCVWLRFPASDRMGGRSRQLYHERIDRQFGALGAEPVDDAQVKSEQPMLHIWLWQRANASISFLEQHHQVWRR